MNLKKMLSVAGSAALLTGCVAMNGVWVSLGFISYSGSVMPGDAKEDELNRPYAAKAAQDFKKRMQFKRAVTLQESQHLALFLNEGRVSASGAVKDPAVLCADRDVRKSLVVQCKGQLRTEIGALRDLKLVGSDENAAPMVSVGDEAAAKPAGYRIVYNITSIDMKDATTSDQLNVTPKFAGAQQPQNTKTWVGSAKVEVQMIDPNGNPVFNFTGDGVSSQDTVDGPNRGILEAAVRMAVTKAMAKYSEKFGPPIYVTQTCQDGQFVQISVGSDYGIREGQKIEFFRNVVRDGATGEKETIAQRVGTGVVGIGKAPVDKDKAWVCVDSFDPENRTVFTWISARILPSK